MPRMPRMAPGGLVFHVLNRANGRATIFEKPADYEAFENVMIETLDLVPMRLLAFCLMPNHWHMILWPRDDGDISRFMHRLTTTHVRRWHLHRHSVGCGHLYQGTFKSFPVQTDNHLLTVCRYVERNPLRARLVERAQDWRWSSLRSRSELPGPPLASWPIERPKNWAALVNVPMTAAELEALRLSLKRGAPCGTTRWRTNTADRLGLAPTLRPRGRPPSST